MILSGVSSRSEHPEAQPASVEQEPRAGEPAGALIAATTGHPPTERAAGRGRAPATEQPGDHEPMRWQTRVRRWAAAVVVLVVVVLWVASRYSHGLFVCRHVADDLGGVSKICNPPGLEDFVPVLLLLVAFIWPDITELDIRGLGRIVKRLDQTNERQDQIAETQDRIAHQLTQVQQVASQRVNVNVADTTALARQIDDLREQLKSLPAGEVPTPPRAEVVGDREAVRSELLESWRQLEPWAEFGRRLTENRFLGWAQALAAGEPPSAAMPDTARRLIERVQTAGGGAIDVPTVRSWYAEREPQLDMVRRTLNDLDGLPARTLNDAAVLSERALADLRSRELIPD